MARPDEHGLGLGQGLSAPGGELRVVPHGVLELRAVRLDVEARSGRYADGAAEHDVVAEDEVGGKLVPQGRRVQLHEPLQLLA